MSSPTEERVVVFTAQSKAYFYCRDVVCEYVFKSGHIPVNPFRVFEYFLGDRVERDWVRQGNNNLIRICNELWVFGPIANGVLFEIHYAQKLNKPVRYFSIGTKASEIDVLTREQLSFEPEVHAGGLKKDDLLARIFPSQDENVADKPEQLPLLREEYLGPK